MKFCSKCGKEIMDEAVICIHCGCSTTNNNVTRDVTDAPNTGFAVLGFFVPMVGLILYILNKETAPLKAKSAGKGALSGFITSTILSIILSIIYVIIMAVLMGTTY